MTTYDWLQKKFMEFLEVFPELAAAPELISSQ